MTDREQIRRDRLKELTAILADHAEDTMDSDDVDQVRAEIHHLYDEQKAELEQAERERDEAKDGLSTLRSAWNYHMDRCEQHKALPVLPPPTAEDMQWWMNAPSDTASGPTPEEWRSRALSAEAQLAKVPALVEALRELLADDDMPNHWDADQSSGSGACMCSYCTKHRRVREALAAYEQAAK